MEVGHAIRDNMMMMSLEAITNRALPILEDGFKPSQRKVLYTMKTMNGATQLSKSANIEGQVMKINPHGSSYSVLVRMTDKAETLLTPFVKGKGSFGKVYSSGMEPAASRYTEAMLMPICSEVMDTLNKHPNNMVDNYDGTTKEPALLSLPFPNVLANPQDGIAIGFACSFPSFNLVELCDACIDAINGKSTMLVPDFTTGASILYDEEQVKLMNETGKGRIELLAKLEDKDGYIEVTEIPYTTTVEKIITEVQKAFDSGKLPEVTDVVDEIGFDGFKMTVHYKNGTDVDNLIAKLYQLTSLRTSYSSNMTLVYKGKPVLMGVQDIIKYWLDHRREWVQEEVDYDIQVKSDRLSLLTGLLKLDIDKAVEIVRGSKNDAVAKEELMKAFKLDEKQAEFVLEIKLRNFNEDYIFNKTKERSKLEKELKALKKLNINDRIIEDLERVKELYGIARKTEVLVDYEVPQPMKVETIKVEDNSNYKVFYSNEKLKVVPATSTAKTPAGMSKAELTGLDELLLFTSNGKVFKHKINKLKGNMMNVNALFRKNELDAGEQVVFVTPLDKEDVVILYGDRYARFSKSLFESIGNKRVFKKGFNISLIPTSFYSTTKEEVDGIKVPHVMKSRLGKPKKW